MVTTGRIGPSWALVPALPTGASRPATDYIPRTGTSTRGRRLPTWESGPGAQASGPQDPRVGLRKFSASARMRGVGPSRALDPMPGAPRPATDDLRPPTWTLKIFRLDGDRRTDAGSRSVAGPRPHAWGFETRDRRPPTSDLDSENFPEVPRPVPPAMATVRALEGHTCTTLNFRSAFHLKISSPESGPNCPVVVWGPT